MKSSILYLIINNIISWVGDELFKPTSSRLIEYLAEDNEKALELLLDRQEYPDSSKIKLGLQGYQTTVFQVRFDLMQNNNRAYEIAIKTNPTVQELEEFASLRVCWSILFPIKKYLLEHSELCKSYKGLLPLGSGVIGFMKEVWPEWKIGNSPSYADHVWLRDLTIQLSNITGLTPVMINHFMYIAGGKLIENKNI